MQKNYVDSRFRTAGSKSESDFSVELPRSFNVPDGVVAHIDDIVIPVSWRTVDERNNQCYISVFCGNAVKDADFTLEPQNHDGHSFAVALAAKLNLALVGVTPLPVMICTYDTLSNRLTISMTDARTETNILPICLQIYTNDTLTLGPPRMTNPATINTIIGNKVQSVIAVAEP